MIEETRGNILNSKASMLVNPVNCVGVMGKGLALQFKRAFPDNFRAYFFACQRGEVQPGLMHISKEKNGQLIVNFPTKRHWRDRSRMEDIVAGLEDLRGIVKANSIPTLALPPIGCGLGGLAWAEVKPLIFSLFSSETVTVQLYEPL